MKYLLKMSVPFITVYAEEVETPESGGSDDSTNTGDSSLQKLADAILDKADLATEGGETETGDPQDKKFTQVDLDRFLATDKRKHQDRLQRSLAEVKALSEKADLTAQERTEFEGRFEQLRKESLTKEQIAAQEKDRLMNDYKTQLDTLTSERNNAVKRYEDSTILREISDASVTNKAISPEQIVAIIRPLTQLVEGVNKEGKPTGKMVTQVSFNDVNPENGEPVEIALSVSDTVKRMREIPKYYNLFQGDGVGGLGSNNVADGPLTDARNLLKTNPKEYRRLRSEGKLPLNSL